MTALEVASLIGTIVFAASGAMLGVRKGFDLLGVIVLGCVTAVGGGALRDTLTGLLPASWFRDERLLWAAIIGALLGFLGYRRLEKRESELEILDALGLSLFAATAAQRGVELGFGVLGVVFIGTVSGVGGGVIRDVLARDVPRIFLPGELYASTAALGCVVIFLLAPIASSEIVLALGTSATFFSRLAARHYRLQLPVRDPNKPLL
ncbi:MAG: trimeric intracellular cation channel family protein [Deinococcales bacterium]